MSALAVFHLIGALHFWLSCYYDWNYVVIPPEVHNMGVSFNRTSKLKYLTFWDALLQATFFTICFLNDVFGTNDTFPKKTPFVRKLKDLMMPALAFPLAMFVGIIFWAIYFVDRELIFPRALDPFFPTWLNHAMHTNIMIFILIEMCTTYRKYPSRQTGLTILSVFMLIYLIWVFIIKAYSNIWVYPILEVLSVPLRAVFFVSLFGFTAMLYLVGEKLNSAVWGKGKQPNAPKNK